MASKGKDKDQELEAQKQLAEAQAAQRRKAEVEGDAEEDPNARVKVQFTGGIGGRAKHREWVKTGTKDEKGKERRVHRLLKRGEKVTMTRRRFAALADRFVKA